MSPYESQSSGNISMGKDLKIPTIREVAEKSKVCLKKRNIPVNLYKEFAKIPGPCSSYGRMGKKKDL